MFRTASGAENYSGSPAVSNYDSATRISMHVTFIFKWFNRMTKLHKKSCMTIKLNVHILLYKIRL